MQEKTWAWSVGPLDGAEHQLRRGSYLDQFLATVRVDFTANGVVRGLLPSFLAFGGFALAWWGNRGRPHPLARPEDAAAAVGLFLLAHLLAVNVGRVTLYSAPLFLPAVALALDRMLDSDAPASG